ncbi:hypothetical protein PG991_013844 [Apiospora marii]|uniref:Secreted protein n=1 Tax=Apiospora marii TaxID=335849 RepID=A0ABR1R7Y8_9PEZI
MSELREWPLLSLFFPCYVAFPAAQLLLVVRQMNSSEFLAPMLDHGSQVDARSQPLPAFPPPDLDSFALRQCSPVQIRHLMVAVPSRALLHGIELLADRDADQEDQVDRVDVTAHERRNGMQEAVKRWR